MAWKFDVPWDHLRPKYGGLPTGGFKNNSSVCYPPCGNHAILAQHIVLCMAHNGGYLPVTPTDDIVVPRIRTCVSYPWEHSIFTYDTDSSAKCRRNLIQELEQVSNRMGGPLQPLAQIHERALQQQALEQAKL